MARVACKVTLGTRRQWRQREDGERPPEGVLLGSCSSTASQMLDIGDQLDTELRRAEPCKSFRRQPSSNTSSVTEQRQRRDRSGMSRLHGARETRSTSQPFAAHRDPLRTCRCKRRGHSSPPLVFPVSSPLHDSTSCPSSISERSLPSCPLLLLRFPLPPLRLRFLDRRRRLRGVPERASLRLSAGAVVSCTRVTLSGLSDQPPTAGRVSSPRVEPWKASRCVLCGCMRIVTARVPIYTGRT